MHFVLFFNNEKFVLILRRLTLERQLKLLDTTKRKNLDSDKRGFKKTSFLVQKLNQNGSVLALIIFFRQLVRTRVCTGEIKYDVISHLMIRSEKLAKCVLSELKPKKRTIDSALLTRRDFSFVMLLVYHSLFDRS